MNVPIHTDLLQQFEALATVPLEQLEWLEQHSKIEDFIYGDFISLGGAVTAGPHFILEGDILLFLKQGNENKEITTMGKGQIFGYLPYSRGVNSSVFAQVITKVKLMSFNTDEIRCMIRDHFELTQALVHTMNNRVREFTALQQQNDKMAALGKLAAGLAHELNNPAAALVSDSHFLNQHLRSQPSVLKELTALQLEPFQVDGVNKELQKILELTDLPRLSLREKTKKEEALSDWLIKKSIANTDEMSEIFADFNFSLGNLDTFGEILPKHAHSSIFNWIMNMLVTEKMLRDIQISSGRIAELIKSVKIYTHMDRGAEKMASDIHDGIRNTLSILGHKFRKGNVEIHENYDESLPPIMAYIGELNQVWTNLIDNALDSLESNKKGKITITTEKEREFVKVKVNDDGPGIPENIKSNIFDPFFTTKEIGKGTGMGLETVQRIILKHRGSIKAESVPGSTTFIICIPIDSTPIPKK